MEIATTDLPAAPGHIPQYVDLLGSKFQYGGRGPDRFDCYGLVIELHKRLGKEVPDVRSPTEQERIASLMGDHIPVWTPCQRGTGAVMTFRIGRYVSHVGMMINTYQFLHIWEGANLGVAVERVDQWERRVAGVYRYNK